MTYIASVVFNRLCNRINSLHLTSHLFNHRYSFAVGKIRKIEKKKEDIGLAFGFINTNSKLIA